MPWCKSQFFTLDPILFYRWGTSINDVRLFGVIFDPQAPFPLNTRFFGFILHSFPAPLKSDIIYGRSFDDLSLLSSLLSNLNLSKWAWLFNVCPCFCVGEVLYFFTFHWLLLPLTFLWVTPHTAEPLWEFFPHFMIS